MRAMVQFAPGWRASLQNQGNQGDGLLSSGRMQPRLFDPSRERLFRRGQPNPGQEQSQGEDSSHLNKLFDPQKKPT